MELFDTHCHCQLSFDSQASMESYMDQADHYLIFTDHLEYHNPYFDTYPDHVPDFDQILAKQAAFKQAGLDLLLGVEVGFLTSHIKAIEKVLDTYDFDAILLSCHQNGDYDYMDEAIKDQVDDPIEEYFINLLDAVETFPQANIFCHFDYGLRIHDLKVSDLKPYEPLIIPIFQAVIEAEMAFELNSKSIYRYGNKELYDYAIDLYQSLGGRRFSLGSDAHQACDLCLNFEDSKQILKSHGVEKVSVFLNQQAHEVKIWSSLT